MTEARLASCQFKYRLPTGRAVAYGLIKRATDAGASSNQTQSGWLEHRQVGTEFWRAVADHLRLRSREARHSIWSAIYRRVKWSAVGIAGVRSSDVC